MQNVPFREDGFEVVFNTADNELNEIVKLSAQKVDYSFKTDELKITFNLYTGNIEKLRGLRVGMLVPVEILLVDSTHTIKYSLFECSLGKVRNFEIEDCSVHLDANENKVLQYVITFSGPKL